MLKTILSFDLLSTPFLLNCCLLWWGKQTNKQKLKNKLDLRGCCSKYFIDSLCQGTIACHVFPPSHRFRAAAQQCHRAQHLPWLRGSRSLTHHLPPCSSSAAFSQAECWGTCCGKVIQHFPHTSLLQGLLGVEGTSVGAGCTSCTYPAQQTAV